MEAVMVKKLGIFLAGGIVGAVAMYFTCPRSGFENRNLAKDAASAVFETGDGEATTFAAQANQVAQNVAAQGQEFMKQAAEKTHEFYATASTKVQEVASNVSAGAAAAVENDALRKKIEAARQRIAAQVVKNAEEAQLVDADVETSEPLEVAVDEITHEDSCACAQVDSNAEEEAGQSTAEACKEEA